MIACEGLYVSFGIGTPVENRVLRNLDLAIREGEFVVVIGSNGAGKSTLLNCLAGEIIPQRGRIVIDGQDVTNQSTEARSRTCARVFQDPMLGTCEAFTIKENLALANSRGKTRGLRQALSRGDIEFFRDRLSCLGLGVENRLDDRMGLLSGGQRQAISLLMATIKEPKILLLDEHTSALDPHMAEKVIDLTRTLVAERSITTLAVTHSMTQALSLGTRTIMMHEGRILLDVSGPERDRLSIPELVSLFSRGRNQNAVDTDALLLAV